MTAAHLDLLKGLSPCMQRVYRKIERLSQSDATVLLYGETGTGKELAAEAIHALSTRASAALVRVNCAALSEDLLNSELFGHVKGAFTGAINGRLGRFEAAQGGTLFLDEIGDISPAIQVSLLRVLEQRCIERVGCNITRPLDVRVIAATNKDLANEVAAGRFRADLFYRLNTVTLTLPPLRERREDIPLLAQHFIRHFNQSSPRKIKGIAAAVLDELNGRPWPGNVRELKNAIEHAFVYGEGEIIGIEDLGPCGTASLRPPWGGRRNGDRRSSAPFLTSTSPSPAAKLDVDTLRNVLEQHHWHLGRTASTLGIHRTTLWRYMQRFGLDSRT